MNSKAGRPLSARGRKFHASVALHLDATDFFKNLGGGSVSQGIDAAYLFCLKRMGQPNYADALTRSPALDELADRIRSTNMEERFVRALLTRHPSVIGAGSVYDLIGYDSTFLSGFFEASTSGHPGDLQLFAESKWQMVEREIYTSSVEIAKETIKRFNAKLPKEEA